MSTAGRGRPGREIAAQPRRCQAQQRPRPQQRPHRRVAACRRAGHAAAGRQGCAATICSQSCQNPAAERGSVDVSFSGGHKVGSRLKRCSPGVNPRCVLVGGRSSRDILSTLPARRADLRGFTMSVTRMYRLCSNASCVTHRVLTGRCAQCVRTYPSSRHGRALAEAAVDGTRVQSALGHREGPK